ncbi:lipid IV(A) 3-deoxy-D-manno-octulosonic acid transferase [Vibrio sp. ZSDZ65]|uniref:3-deoxy-D-manno-octulosonic acid transferase n=1 Tax=Vibrio qingdaonensis TaxID=2829491 RepID=A0A9X3CR48_9VIBR|nr:lipid IV(A) 3-deoxy-D-manno-octulosonic acid transferase [Vibrio qingdaonensis]MCW8348058.1 lipid IV(A) 3-deoxy-D-manno-octulosonic acid transferase [Vibrio qingdaonensis]
MLRIIYTLLLLIVAPFFLVNLFKSKPGKPNVGHRWKEHFGITPPLNNTSKEVVWFHTVSVGEVIAATPLIRRYAAQNPDKAIVVTTTTPTGAEQADKLSDIATHRYMPLDFGFAVHRFVRTIKPTLLVIMETELWPNTLTTVAKFQIPIVVINARLSERSYLRYLRFKPIFEMTTQHLTHIACQYQEDADRFTKLGINSNIISVSGSIKFDITINDEDRKLGNQLRNILGQNRPVWIAASTHNGEEEIALEAHQQLIKTMPNALLIIVPRHPERFESVFQLCQTKGLTVEQKTNITKALPEHTQVFLGNTMGEMIAYLVASDICFMGGSLVGTKVGGHNLLEPAAVGIPSITGPSYYNFTEVTHLLLKNNATMICQSSQELEHCLSSIWSNKEVIKEMTDGAIHTVAVNRGTLENTLLMLNAIIIK